MPSYWTPNKGESNVDFFAGYDEARIPVRVPAGTYTAILTSWKADKNQKGTPCVKLSYQIAGGDYSGQIITEQRFLTANAMGYTKRFFDSMGIDPRRSVSDYPEIWVELQTTVQDGEDNRQYTNVIDGSVRRIVPSAKQTQETAPGSGSFSQSQSELPPGAF